MGCVWRSYPRIEFLEQIPFLKLDEKSYENIKSSITNPDYKELAVKKFYYSYLYDLSSHGLKIDFDRYFLMHLIAYKEIIEPYTSSKHAVDLNKLDTRLQVILQNDDMLKAFKSNLEGFKYTFSDDIKKLKSSQHSEIAAHLARQFAILQGGNWNDVVDKWINLEKSLGLHALKSLAASPRFWNYFMATITLREHYSTLLEKEKVLLKAGEGGYIKWDDWEIIRKWYDKAGTLTDVEFHLKNAQQSLEKFIFRLEWIPFLAGEFGSEFLAGAIAKGFTSFLWDTARTASIMFPAGRLARGSFLIAKWFSQSIITFATWLGIEWMLDGFIQTVMRTPVEKLQELLGLPSEVFGITKEDFSYLINYLTKKQALNLNITDPYAAELFARLHPKGQAVLLSLVHRARIKKIAREAKKRIRQTINDILPKIPNLPEVRTKCFDVKLPSPEEMYNLFNTLTELYDAQAKLSIIGLTGNDNENITVQTRDESFGNAIRKVFEYSQPPPPSVRERHPNYPPASGRLEATLNIYTGFAPDGFPVNNYSFSFYNDSVNICYFHQPEPPPFDPHLEPPPIIKMVIKSDFNSFGYGFYQDCNRFYYGITTQSISSYTDQCNMEGSTTSRFSSFSIYIRRRPYTSSERESGDKSIVKLIRLLFTLKPSYALRLDENLYRLYMRPLTVNQKLTASKLIMLPSKPMYYSYSKRVDYELYMYQGHSDISIGRGTVKETFKLSKMLLNTYSYYLFFPSPDMIYIFYYYYVYHLPPVELQKQIVITHPYGGTHTEGSLNYGQHMKREYKSDSLQIPVIERRKITPVSLTNAPEYPDDFNIPDVNIPPCVNKVQISD